MSVLRRARARLRIGMRRRPGVSEAGREAGRRTGYALRRGGGAVRSLAGGAAPYITAVLSLPIVLAAQLIAVGSRLVAWCLARVDSVSAAVRPEPAVAAVAAGCCLALAASQFVAYSGIAVDAPAYGGQIGRVAPAPIAGAEDTGTAHAYLMIPVAAVALFLTAATLRGRWRLGRLVALCGLIAVLVSLLVDLPQGIDAGDTGLAYGGSEARLLEGFWAQLAAGAVLLFCGVLLGQLVKRSHGGHEPVRRAQTREERRAERQRRRVEHPVSGRRLPGRRWRAS